MKPIVKKERKTWGVGKKRATVTPIKPPTTRGEGLIIIKKTLAFDLKQNALLAKHSKSIISLSFDKLQLSTPRSQRCWLKIDQYSGLHSF